MLLALFIFIYFISIIFIESFYTISKHLSRKYEVQSILNLVLFSVSSSLTELSNMTEFSNNRW